MSKPTAFGLSAEATKFVVSNWRSLASTLKYLFPLFLVLEGVRAFHLLPTQPGIRLFLLLVSVFIYAVFCLSWHKSSLAGVDSAHTENPFKLSKSDLKFMAMFIPMTILLTFLIYLLFYVLKVYLPYFDPGLQVVAKIATVGAAGFIIIEWVRLCYFLPAQSMGMTLSWSEAKRISKATLWPLLGSIVIFVVLYSVLSGLYFFITALVIVAGTGSTESLAMQMTKGGVTAVDAKAAMTVFFMNVPVHLAGFVTMALIISAISNAYRWSMENISGR